MPACRTSMRRACPRAPALSSREKSAAGLSSCTFAATLVLHARQRFARLFVAAIGCAPQRQPNRLLVVGQRQADLNEPRRHRAGVTANRDVCCRVDSRRRALRRWRTAAGLRRFDRSAPNDARIWVVRVSCSVYAAKYAGHRLLFQHVDVALQLVSQNTDDGILPGRLGRRAFESADLRGDADQANVASDE